MKKLQPREREDAVNEIRIMASIKHKNIVRYCDAFLEKDNLYIAMEFAGEENARHKVGREREGERGGREGISCMQSNQSHVPFPYCALLCYVYDYAIFHQCKFT